MLLVREMHDADDDDDGDAGENPGERSAGSSETRLVWDSSIASTDAAQVQGDGGQHQDCGAYVAHNSVILFVVTRILAC